MDQINSDFNPIQAAIDWCGTISNLAKALGVTPQAVSFWRDGLRQLPADKCPLIERVTEGVVTCEMLRTDVDWAYIRCRCKAAAELAAPQQTPAQAAQEAVAVGV